MTEHRLNADMKKKYHYTIGPYAEPVLRVKPGDYGTVVEVRVFNRHGVDKDERALQIEREEVERTLA